MYAAVDSFQHLTASRMPLYIHCAGSSQRDSLWQVMGLPHACDMTHRCTHKIVVNMLICEQSSNGSGKDAVTLPLVTQLID